MADPTRNQRHKYLHGTFGTTMLSKSTDCGASHTIYEPPLLRQEVLISLNQLRLRMGVILRLHLVLEPLHFIFCR